MCCEALPSPVLSGKLSASLIQNETCSYLTYPPLTTSEMSHFQLCKIIQKYKKKLFKYVCKPVELSKYYNTSKANYNIACRYPINSEQTEYLLLRYTFNKVYCFNITFCSIIDGSWQSYLDPMILKLQEA